MLLSRKGPNYGICMVSCRFCAPDQGSGFLRGWQFFLARLLRVPSVIIGLTIVAMGTSAPEASVSMSAALSGSNEIALSNVIGSNIFNGLVVVGICAFMAAFSTNKDILKRDLPLNILITFILCIFACKRSTQPSGRDPSSDRYDSVSDLYGHICPEKQTGRRKWQGVVPCQKVFCISPVV